MSDREEFLCAAAIQAKMQKTQQLDRQAMREDADREVDEQGCQISTRGALLRFGYCCGERCKQCPYFNWVNIAPWYPPPTEIIQYRTVPARTLAVLRGRFALQQLLKSKNTTEEEIAYHQILLQYYFLLWQRWSSE